MKDDKIRKKIKRLLELARRGGTEAEAANAMEKVHKLLLRHNLKLSDVDVRDYDMLVEDIPKGHEWEIPLWMGVAQLYLSKYMIGNGPQPKHILCGQHDNMVIARETIRQLMLIANELTAKFAETAREIVVPQRDMWGNVIMMRIPNLHFADSVESFRRGFAARVHNRCVAEIEKAKHMGAQDQPDVASGDKGGIIGTALTVRALYEQEAERVASFLSESGMETEQKQIDIHATDHQAFMNGFLAGGDVTLQHKGALK